MLYQKRQTVRLPSIFGLGRIVLYVPGILSGLNTLHFIYFRKAEGVSNNHFDTTPSIYIDPSDVSV